MNLIEVNMLSRGNDNEVNICVCRAYQRAMVKSMTLAATVPHFHFVEEINCDELIELKSAFQKENTDPEIKFSFLPVLIKSLSMALTTHPLVNSTFNLETYEVTLKGAYTLLLIYQLGVVCFVIML